MREAAVVEVVEDAASDLCIGSLWLTPDYVLIVTAHGFAELCELVRMRLAEVVDEADRRHEEWRTSPRLMRYRDRPLRFVDAGHHLPAR